MEPSNTSYLRGPMPNDFRLGVEDGVLVYHFTLFGEAYEAETEDLDELDEMHWCAVMVHGMLLARHHEPELVDMPDHELEALLGRRLFWDRAFDAAIEHAPHRYERVGDAYRETDAPKEKV